MVSEPARLRARLLSVVCEGSGFRVQKRRAAYVMPRVLVVPPIVREHPNEHREILEAGGFEVVYPTVHERFLDRPTLLANLHGIDAVIAGAERYDADVFAASRLRVVARYGVGYDAVDIEAATRAGIPVTITPGTNEDSVAEQALALLFAVLRQVPNRDRSVREGVWKRSIGARLRGKTLGLVGLGRIGRALAWRAVGLGLNVITHDPCADMAFCDKHRVRTAAFEELLREADIVSVHLPWTAATTHLFDARAFESMKPGAIFLNTARGPLMDEAALVAGLESGHLGGAGLDVFEQEPLAADSPLLRLPNVVLSPHVGGWDNESVTGMANLAAHCMVDLYQGRWPDGCVVNEQLRPGWRW